MLISILISVAMLVYPFLVYYGLNEYGPAAFAVLLFILLLVRVVANGNYRDPSQWLQLIVVSAFCLVVVVIQSEDLLKFYPVLMNVGFSLLFAFSLKSETCLIERFARMSGQDIPEKAIGYLRKLTLVWAILLLVNAMVSAYTACCMSLKEWTIYNGLISYFILGGFVLVEFVFRGFYKKKIEAEEDSV